jgi:DNA-binding NarL/FixJ family response regulator
MKDQKARDMAYNAEIDSMLARKEAKEAKEAVRAKSIASPLTPWRLDVLGDSIKLLTNKEISLRLKVASLEARLSELEDQKKKPKTCKSCGQEKK